MTLRFDKSEGCWLILVNIFLIEAFLQNIFSSETSDNQMERVFFCSLSNINI